MVRNYSHLFLIHNSYVTPQHGLVRAVVDVVNAEINDDIFFDRETTDMDED